MKIVVDTNIVFSAILNSTRTIGKILLNSKGRFQFYTCDYLRIEIQRHRNKLLTLTKLSEDELAELEVLITHNITFIDERVLPRDILLQTETLLQSIDPNNTPFVALATYLEGKHWTGDMQLYRGLTSKQFKNIILTADLSLLLDNLERQ